MGSRPYPKSTRGQLHQRLKRNRDGLTYWNGKAMKSEAELARLRAEAERLRTSLDAETQTVNKVWAALEISTYEQVKPLSIWEHVERLKRERDEALAQVAWLFSKLVTTSETLLPTAGEMVREARALLDRLQLAEVVVEAALEVIESVTFSGIMGPTLPHIDGKKMVALREALAAWEEGK